MANAQVNLDNLIGDAVAAPPAQQMLAGINIPAAVPVAPAAQPVLLGAAAALVAPPAVVAAVDDDDDDDGFNNTVFVKDH